MIAGIALAFPFHVYFVAEFVLPALTRKERKYLLPGIVAPVPERQPRAC